MDSEKHYSPFELLGLKALFFYSLSSNISKLDIFLYSLKQPKKVHNARKKTTSVKPFVYTVPLC